MASADNISAAPAAALASNAPANALTVDVEDYFHVAALASEISRDDWSNIAPRVEVNTRRLLDVFDAVGVRGTFFVLGDFRT